MKSMNSKLIAVTAALTLCAGMALAQAEGGGQKHHPHGNFMRGMELPLRQLNLTDEQKTQIKQIFQAEKPTMKPLMQQEHALKVFNNLRDLAESPLVSMRCLPSHNAASLRQVMEDAIASLRASPAQVDGQAGEILSLYYVRRIRLKELEEQATTG